MRNDVVKSKVEDIIGYIDGWLESIDNDTPPVCDMKTDNESHNRQMQTAYEAGAYKARAQMNADKLRRVKSHLLNEFKEIGVQSRTQMI
jgi:hypothetical protein